MLDQKMLEDKKLVDNLILYSYKIGSDEAYSDACKIRIKLIKLSVKLERKLWPLRKMK